VKHLRTCFSLIGLLFWPACRSRAQVSLSESDVPGVYICNFETELQKIEILPDGTFKETIGTGSTAAAFTGKWWAKIDDPNKESLVYLNPYHFGHATPSADGEVAAWMPVFRWDNDSAWLSVSVNEGLRCSRSILSRAASSDNAR
jgi:hypothetical protein